MLLMKSKLERKLEFGFNLEDFLLLTVGFYFVDLQLKKELLKEYFMELIQDSTT
jgi:hypothetical protein